LTYRREYERGLDGFGRYLIDNDRPLMPGWADAAGAAAGATEREERHTAKAPPRFSPAAREKMAASQRARWAEKRAAKGQK
jgi:hypothetical protein